MIAVALLVAFAVFWIVRLALVIAALAGAAVAARNRIVTMPQPDRQIVR